ncbi:MAG TPA: hypothetical protein VHG89_12015 [Verrucomicrobiae bacterium]|nr:hypothetical protein [Verrucomicrobiae bacterium]
MSRRCFGTSSVRPDSTSRTAALGHNSKAVHRSYAKKAVVIVPTLEEYEKKQAANAVVVKS